MGCAVDVGDDLRGGEKRRLGRRVRLEVVGLAQQGQQAGERLLVAVGEQDLARIARMIRAEAKKL